jgi:hypothetical protein
VRITYASTSAGPDTPLAATKNRAQGVSRFHCLVLRAIDSLTLLLTKDIGSPPS